MVLVLWEVISRLILIEIEDGAETPQRSADQREVVIE